MSEIVATATPPNALSVSEFLAQLSNLESALGHKAYFDGIALDLETLSLDMGAVIPEIAVTLFSTTDEEGVMSCTLSTGIASDEFRAGGDVGGYTSIDTMLFHEKGGGGMGPLLDAIASGTTVHDVFCFFRYLFSDEFPLLKPDYKVYVRGKPFDLEQLKELFKRNKFAISQINFPEHYRIVDGRDFLSALRALPGVESVYNSTKPHRAAEDSKLLAENIQRCLARAKYLIDPIEPRTKAAPAEPSEESPRVS